MLVNVCNKYYLVIDIYQCNYNFVLISPLMLADGAGKGYKWLM